MSFKISVPRTNYIQNKKVVDSPVQMTQAALQSQGRAIGYREAASTFGLQSSRPTGGSDLGEAAAFSGAVGSAVGDRGAASTFGLLCSRPTGGSDSRGSAVGDLGEAAAFSSAVGCRFGGGLKEAHPSEVSKGVYKVPDDSYSSFWPNQMEPSSKSPLLAEASSTALRPASPRSRSLDYDISKLLKDDNQHVTNSFDLIKDIDDCSKINEIFNKMFCNIDNNTLRDQFSESLKNKKKVDPVFINKFHEVVDVDLREAGFSFFSNKKESTNHKDLYDLDPVKTGFFDVDPPVEGGDCFAASVEGSDSRGVGDRGATAEKPVYLGPGSAVGNCRADSFDSDSRGSAVGDRFSGAVGDCDPLHGLDDTRTEGGDLREAAARGGDRSAAASSSREAVVNTKVIGTEGVNIKKKNTRRKKNNKNKRM